LGWAVSFQKLQDLRVFADTRGTIEYNVGQIPYHEREFIVEARFFRMEIFGLH
jgi:hypothetical protein